jgi:hypothetical protein
LHSALGPAPFFALTVALLTQQSMRIRHLPRSTAAISAMAARTHRRTVWLFMFPPFTVVGYFRSVVEQLSKRSAASSWRSFGREPRATDAGACMQLGQMGERDVGPSPRARGAVGERRTPMVLNTRATKPLE